MTLEDLRGMAGKELGVSGWTLIDQARINEFARCTGDNQWIHVDVERARRESPSGGTIAHGYLLLSLIAGLSMEVGVVPPDVSAAFNYGLDKVRFLAPVPAGSKVRLRVTVESIEAKDNGQYLLRTKNAIEVENGGKPAVIADTLALLMP